MRALTVILWRPSSSAADYLQTKDVDNADRVEVSASVTSHKRRDLALEHIVGRLSSESGVSRASWRAETHSV